MFGRFWVNVSSLCNAATVFCWILLILLWTTDCSLVWYLHLTIHTLASYPLLQLHSYNCLFFVFPFFFFFFFFRPQCQGSNSRKSGMEYCLAIEVHESEVTWKDCSSQAPFSHIRCMFLSLCLLRFRIYVFPSLTQLSFTFVAAFSCLDLQDLILVNYFFVLLSQAVILSYSNSV